MSSSDIPNKPTLGQRLTSLFESTAAFCVDQRYGVLCVFALCIGIAVWLLPKLQVDFSAEARLHITDPARIQFEAFKRDFDGDDLVFISVPLPKVINDDFLTRLQTLQLTIEQDLWLVSKTTSMLNALHNYSVDDVLVIEDLLEGWPEQPLETKWPKDSLRTFLMTHPNYRNRLISADGNHTALILELSQHHRDQNGNISPVHNTQKQQTIAALRVITERLYPNAAISGVPAVDEALNRNILKDNVHISSSAIAVIIIILVFFFRRIFPVFATLLVIMTGGMALFTFLIAFQQAFTLITSVMPVIGVAVGAANSIHLLSQFYRIYDGHNKRQAIIEASGQSSPAILLTNLTTMAGFISFASADLASVQQLGIFAAIAVLGIFLATVLILPALIGLLRLKSLPQRQRSFRPIVSFNESCVRFSCRHAKMITVSSVLLLGVAGFYALKLGFSDDSMNVFPAPAPIKQDFLAMDAQYHGLNTFEVIIDSGTAQGVHEPNFLAKLSTASALFSNTEWQGLRFSDSYSVLNILRETHKSLNGNNPGFYRIPDNKIAIAQTLLLFEMSEHDALRDVVDEQAQKARLTLKVRHEDGALYHDAIKHLQKELDGLFGVGKSHITGNIPLAADAVPRALSSMAKSYAVAFVLITLLIAMLNGGIRIGLVSMLPNLLPIVIAMNVLLFLGWNLDQTTMTIGAIAMGLVVDDTLHYLYHFRQHHQQHGQTHTAAVHAIRHCGVALLITTLVFVACNGLHITSSLPPFMLFGGCISLIALLALLADLLIAPAVLSLFYGHRNHQQ